MLRGDSKGALPLSRCQLIRRHQYVVEERRNPVPLLWLTEKVGQAVLQSPL